MTVIGINGKLYEFPGPVELPVYVCPICGSEEIVDSPDGVTCLECGSAFARIEDLNQELRRYGDDYQV